MLPKGIIWQQLRQRALNAIPEGTVVSYASPMTADEWLVTGAFHVSGSTKTSFELDAPSVDVGAMLFGESSYLADHAIEHAVGMRNQIAAAKWQSSAWSMVSIYYWTFFVVLALTRLQGETGMYIPAAIVKKLKGLSANPHLTPGAGPFVFQCGDYLSASQRKVILRRASQTRVHDAVWNMWFTWIRKIIKANTINARDLEGRAYQSIVRSANALGDTWPSDLRNLLNYVPGAGYGTVRSYTPADVLGQIQIDPASTWAAIIDRFEANVGTLDPNRPLQLQVRAAARVLIDFCLLVDVISWELLADISQRRSIDRRWLNARVRFMKTHSQGFTNHPWPCLDIPR